MAVSPNKSFIKPQIHDRFTTFKRDRKKNTLALNAETKEDRETEKRR